MQKLRHRKTEDTVVTTSLPVAHMDTFIAALRDAGHEAEDTGRRITTEAGPEAEGYVRVRLRH